MNATITPPSDTAGHYIYIVMYSITSIGGIFGSLLTFAMLRRMVSKHGSSHKHHASIDLTTRYLLQSQALCESLESFLLIFAVCNHIGGIGTWPFYLPRACQYYTFLVSLQFVALGHSLCIAVIRFVAVYKPKLYGSASLLGKRSAVAAVAVAWLYGAVPTIIGLCAKLFTARLIPETGACMTYLYDEQTTKESGYFAFLATMTVTNIYVPLVLGLGLYTAVIYRLHRNHRAHKIAAKAHSTQSTSIKVINVGPKESRPLANNPIIVQQVTTAAANITSARLRQHHALMAVAIAQIIQLCIQFPFAIDAVINSDNYDDVAMRIDIVVFDALFNVPCATTAIVYYIASMEMRNAYVSVIKSCNETIKKRFSHH